MRDDFAEGFGHATPDRLGSPDRPLRPVGIGIDALVGAAGLLLALILAASVYGIYGRLGFYGEGLFVILKEQADLSQAPAIIDPSARRFYVYSTLVHHAEDTQAALRGEPSSMASSPKKSPRRIVASTTSWPARVAIDITTSPSRIRYIALGGSPWRNRISPAL